MSKTVSLYQATENGWLRIGSFTPRGSRSIRNISDELVARFPAYADMRLYVANRTMVMGKWVDGERIPLDFGR